MTLNCLTPNLPNSMNFACMYAYLSEDPREVFTSANSTAMRCSVMLPPVGNKAPTQLDLNIYGKNADRFSKLGKGTYIYIHGSKLRFDLESRTHSLHGGTVVQVNDQFPMLNTVILGGRCVKDIATDDARAFKTTESGLMICNQTLSVNTGRNQADLFNFYAINTAEDKLNNAELLVNFTRKGVGLTIQGRLVTDSWKDNNGEKKSQTKIQLVSMTLAPKGTSGSTQEIKPSTTLSSETAAPLWGGRETTEESDPWSVNTVLPDLPGQYGAAPELEEAPF